MRSFSWNKVRYRADRPISELMDTLQKASSLSSLPVLLSLTDCVGNCKYRQRCEGKVQPVQFREDKPSYSTEETNVRFLLNEASNSITDALNSQRKPVDQIPHAHRQPGATGAGLGIPRNTPHRCSLHFPERVSKELRDAGPHGGASFLDTGGPR